MTSALGLKLQEAIEANEARKAMANWNEPMTTITPTLSASEATFNTVRDNPGKTKSQIVALLDTQSYKAATATSMLSIMLRYGILIEEEGKTLRAIGEVYKSRVEFNPRLKQKLGPKSKTRKLKVNMIKTHRPEWTPPVAVEAKPDVINSPAHYKGGNIETIDYIQAKLTPEEFVGYLKGNVLKYASRAGYKGNAMEDTGKLAWYANRLAEQS